MASPNIPFQKKCLWRIKQVKTDVPDVWREVVPLPLFGNREHLSPNVDRVRMSYLVDLLVCCGGTELVVTRKQRYRCCCVRYVRRMAGWVSSWWQVSTDTVWSEPDRLSATSTMTALCRQYSCLRRTDDETSYGVNHALERCECAGQQAQRCNSRDATI